MLTCVRVCFYTCVRKQKVMIFRDDRYKQGAVLFINCFKIIYSASSMALILL